MKQKRNKMWKRMFSMFLVVAMLITALPVTAFAKPEEKQSEFGLNMQMGVFRNWMGVEHFI